jgi:ABC-type Fe3+/spermidine/putrescine transport system ATPase subunit
MSNEARTRRSTRDAAKLEISNLVKRYGDHLAVNDVSLTVRPGECVALLGPSGCGKTTTLRCVAGLESVTSGQITIGEQTVATATSSVPAEKRGIGMVFQSYAIWPHLSVFENVAFGLRVEKRSKAEITERVRQALDTVGLAGYEGRSASLLSGGQQQRVALARAIAVTPSVLLFDEPLSNLDAKLRERMRFELRDLQQRLGLTALYVTHDQEEAMVIADRIVVMNGGAIEQTGSAEEIYCRPSSRFVASFIGSANIIPCRVLATDRARIVVETSWGLRLAVSNTNDIQGLTRGRTVHVLMRPSEIRLINEEPASSDVNNFKVTVRKQSFLGAYTAVEVGVDDGSTLSVSVTPARRFEPGSQVWAVVDPASAIVLND